MGTAWWRGGGCGFCIREGGQKGAGMNLMHFPPALAVRRAIRITNTQAEKERRRGRERAPQTQRAGGNRMYFSDNNTEPIEDARRRTFIPALPHLW